MELTRVILSEIIQAQKDKHHNVFSLLYVDVSFGPSHICGVFLDYQ